MPIDTLTSSDGASSSDRRTTIVVGSGLLVTYLVVSISALWVRSPLGHDESVYALRSRDLLSGWTSLSGNYWRDYRAPGLPIMLSGLGRVIGIHVITARAFVVLLGLVVVVCTAVIGWRLASRTVGFIAAALLIVTFGFVWTTTTLLADTPGAAFALLAVVSYLLDVQRGRLRLSLVLVPLLALVSTLSRFGAPFMLGAGLLAVALVWAPDVLRRRMWRLVAESVLLAAVSATIVALVLLTDLFTLDGESPAAANQHLVARNEFTVSTGARDLLGVVNPWSTSPFQLWSKPVSLLMLVGLVLAGLAAVVDVRRRKIVVFAVVAGSISLACVVATVGLIVPNYLLLTLPYWVLAVACGWDHAVRTVMKWTPVPDRTFVRGLQVVAVGVFALLALDVSSQARRAHEGYVVAYDGLRAASVAARAELGPQCVLISRYQPQVGYYSTCRTGPFLNWDAPAAQSLADSVSAVVAEFSLGIPPDSPIATVAVQGSIRQPPLEDLVASDELYLRQIFVSGSPGTHRGYLVLGEVDPCVATLDCQVPGTP